MNSVRWSDVRADAVRYFNGELPRAELEQSVMDIFEQQPQVVIAALERVAARFSAGKIRSGWAIWKMELENASAPADVEVDLGDRDRAIRCAELWLHNAGLHFDREEEIEDELFGDWGVLRPWRDEEALRERLLSQWRARERPRGVQIETESAEATAERKRIAAKLAAAATTIPEPEADWIGEEPPIPASAA